MQSKPLSSAIRLTRKFLTNKPKKPLIVVLGPTSSGKTELAIRLSQGFKGEIVSADSRQIYRELDRGTAKPNAKELRAVTHHLVSVFSPNQTVDVAAYRRLVEQKIREILKRGHLPILAGGHTLLISAIVENYQFPKVRSDPAHRQELERIYKTKNGSTKLWRQLNKLDPIAAEKIPSANRYHLIRALELAEQLGQMGSTKQKGKSKYDTLLLGLNPPREKLYERINLRVNKMMRAGLLAEVKKLAKKYDRYTPALRGHGYRELLDHLSGEETLEQAVEKMKKDTRNYAKRQATWWRNSGLSKEIHWLDCT